MSKEETTDKLYVLVMDEYDGDSSYSINVVASYDEKALEMHKSFLEVKSAAIRETLAEFQDQQKEELTPLWEKYNEITRKMRGSTKQEAMKEKRKKIQDKMGVVHQKFYKLKDDLLKEMDVTHYIDDPEDSSFNIEEVPLLEVP